MSGSSSRVGSMSEVCSQADTDVSVSIDEDVSLYLHRCLNKTHFNSLFYVLCYIQSLVKGPGGSTLPAVRRRNSMDKLPPSSEYQYPVYSMLCFNGSTVVIIYSQ